MDQLENLSEEQLKELLKSKKKADKRSETSKKNAQKARVTKLAKLQAQKMLKADKKPVKELDDIINSDDDSEEEVIYFTKSNKKHIEQPQPTNNKELDDLKNMVNQLLTEKKIKKETKQKNKENINKALAPLWQDLCKYN